MHSCLWNGFLIVLCGFLSSYFHSLGASDSIPGSVMYSKFLSWPNREKAILTREETGGKNDVPHPTLASDLPVEVAGHIARDAAGQGIQQDGC